MPRAPDPAPLRHGLSHKEAIARLSREGANEIPQSDRRTIYRIAADVVREPMLSLLLAGGLVYLALGDVKEALILLAFGCLSVLISVVQETRTERVLEALRDMSSPRAVVIRDGDYSRIAGREVVRGDLLLLSEGDRVAADAYLLDARDLEADESLLTGESLPIKKTPGAGPPTVARRPGGGAPEQVFAGSLIVRGSGIGEVTATGPASALGKMGQSLRELGTISPPLQSQMRRLVWIFAIVGVGVSCLVVTLYGLLRGGWLDAGLAGIAIGMSMLPEEVPLVLTVFMAIGAWRISKARVLTRRAASIEALGSATVLCTDKTGTLTENRMKVVELRLPDGQRVSVDDAAAALAEVAELVSYGALASAPVPFDPMEKAIHALARRNSLEDQSCAARTLIKSYAVQPRLLAMSQVWSVTDGDASLIVAAKGAPETIAALCRITGEERAALSVRADEMAASGLRVLGVARATCPENSIPASQEGFAFTFLGLIGLADPLRPSVPAAMNECRDAGIKVVMITGDYPTTACAIARQAGFPESEFMTGDQLAILSDEQLAERMRTATIFARIMPEQKLRIVEALKADGHVVAMTGDGVNDAPSLKAAHIGIAMGSRGSDVAREASSIVLLDDDFGSIVTTIRLGRRIYDNIRKAMGFIFAVHVPIAGLSLLPLVFGLPILFGPIHIAFLEMIIDPVCSLVFEAEKEEADVMKRPPRDSTEPLFSLSMIFWSLFQGTVAFVLIATAYLIGLYRGMPADELRALTFFSLVFSIIALIFANRSIEPTFAGAFQRPNRALVIALFGVALGLGVTQAASISDLFKFGPLGSENLAVALVVGAILLGGLQLFKHFRARAYRELRLPRA